MRKPRIGTAVCLSFVLVGGVAAQDPVVEHYTQTYNVSVEEATRRLSYVDRAMELERTLAASEPTRFAGLYIDNGPQFRVVVKLVGGAQQLLARYTTDPVFVGEQARTPLRALQARREAVSRRLQGSTDRFSTSFDVRANKVRVFVRDTVRARALLASELGTGEDTEIQRTDQFEELVATIRGGTPVDGPTVGGTYEIATLGFVVRNASGTRGLLTAGHFGECIGMPSGCVRNGGATASGAALAFQAQAYSGNNDFEWHTATGHTLPNEIRYSSTNMAVTGALDPTQFPVGTTVCKQGRTTGYQCGTIEEVAYQRTNNGAVGTFVRVKSPSGASMAEPGDSGGPVFGANTAYGIIHAKVVATGMVGHMLFMPITRISGLGLSVATTP